MPASNIRQFLFDDLYAETIDETEHSIKRYLDVYNLDHIFHEENVPKGFFDYVKSKKYFIIIAVYDSEGRFLLHRTTERFGWELPGGSISKNETIFQAVKRNAKVKISPNIKLSEVEPVVIVTNKFLHENDRFLHRGLVFLARSRQHLAFTPTDTCKFVNITPEELENVRRYANKRALEVCLSRIKHFETKKQDNEIDANETARSKYIFHNLFMKKFLLTKKRKKKEQQISIISSIVGDSKYVLDVSCGDSAWPQQIVNRNPSVDVFFANDISWSQVELGASKDPRIKYSNHDAQYLPFRKKVFDLAICMNTLHHMPSRNHLTSLLQSMDNVAKSILIWEVSDPKKDRALPKFLNKYYYEWFLDDQGVAYIDDMQFQELLRRTFPERDIAFDQFVNIQGKYNYAIVRPMSKAKSNTELEVESKYYYTGHTSLKLCLIKKGYKKFKTTYQSDIYFSDSSGYFVHNNTCLRIRSNESGKISIDYKGPSSDLAASVITKIERNIPLLTATENEVEDFLTALGFYRHVEVKKKRDIFKTEKDKFSVSVFIDEIDSLGTFIELELTSADTTLEEEATALLKILEDEFKEFLGETVTIPYRDLVAENLYHSVIGSNIKVIAFDLDGTLLPKTNKLFFDAWNEVSIRDYNYAISYDDYHQHEVEEGEELFEIIKKKLSLEVKREAYFSPIYDLYRAKITALASSGELCRFFSPLEAIPKHYKLALVTHSRREFVEDLLTRCNAHKYFELILCREDLEKLKPDPSGYYNVMKKLDIQPEELLVVEDSKKGAQSALAAGAKVVMVGLSSEWAEEQQLPHISTCAELALLSISANP